MRVRGRHLNELRDDADAAVVVAAAYDAGVFGALGAGGGTPAEIAERAGLEPRAVSVVLGALESLGLLRRREGRYEATPACRAGLSAPASDEFVGGGLPQWLANLRALTRLGEALRTGGPVGEPTGRRDEAGLRRLLAAMAAAPAARVERIVDLCLARRPGARSMLDLGGGPGHMARAFARRGLRATLFDTPETIALLARERPDHARDLTLAGGDFHEDPLPVGPFDLVLLSNVLHIYGPEANRALLRKVAAIVAPRGVAAIADFLRGRSARAPLFAVLMLLRTEAGDTYTEEECREWLEAAGFGDVRVEDADRDRQLVTGVLRRRAGRSHRQRAV